MSAHPLDKYFNKSNDANAEGSNLDYEKESPHPLDKYFNQPSKTQSVISALPKGLLRGAQNVNPINFGPISNEVGRKLLNQALPTRNERSEQILESAGELLPLVAMGPEGLLAKGAQLAGGTLARQFAKEEELGPAGEAIFEIGGMTLPGMFKGLINAGKNLMGKGAAKRAGETAAKVARISPTEINQGVIDSAKRLGVLEDIPLSAQTSNPLIQSLETKLTQSAKGGPLQKKIEGLGGKLVKEYEEVGNSLSNRANLLPGAVSEEAVNVLKAIEDVGENSYRSLYAQGEKALPKGAATIPIVGKAINRVLDSTINKLKSSLGTPAKDALYSRLTRLRENWNKLPAISNGEIPIQELLDLKRDLNQVIKYEVKGGVDKLLNPLFGVTKNGIQTYGRQFNKPFLNRFNQAEKIFAENSKNFRKNQFVSSLLEGGNPERIFNKMNSVSGINELEKIFAKSPEGKEMWDVLKKYKLENLLNNKILDKSGKISWGKAAGMFKDAKTREVVSRLVGPEQYKRLKDLATVANGVEEGFKKFLNTSRTEVARADLNVLVKLPIEAAKQLFTGHPIEALKAAGQILLPSQVAKIAANPEFVDAAITAAKAGKGTNPKKFIDAVLEVARISAQELMSTAQQSEENQ